MQIRTKPVMSLLQTVEFKYISSIPVCWPNHKQIMIIMKKPFQNRYCHNFAQLIEHESIKYTAYQKHVHQTITEYDIIYDDQINKNIVKCMQDNKLTTTERNYIIKIKIKFTFLGTNL